MKTVLLLDANLSWRSVAVLRNHFDNCFHVDDVGLSVPAKDYKIWEYAQANDLIIVTNDEDFVDLSIVKGFPPKVILLKTGNQSRKATELLLIQAKDQIIEFQISLEYGILELF